LKIGSKIGPRGWLTKTETNDSFVFLEGSGTNAKNLGKNEASFETQINLEDYDRKREILGIWSSKTRIKHGNEAIIS
ncbi:hypothetical protein HAX54_048877, partial [Datura stramonium]|nr:hypothetical protein [Datura stramonium]